MAKCLYDLVKTPQNCLKVVLVKYFIFVIFFQNFRVLVFGLVYFVLLIGIIVASEHVSEAFRYLEH